MDEKGLVDGMRDYISRLGEEERFSTAKSYRDALNSLVRYRGMEDIPYSYLSKGNLRRYESYLVERGCSRNTIPTYMRRIRGIYKRKEYP